MRGTLVVLALAAALPSSGAAAEAESQKGSWRGYFQTVLRSLQDGPRAKYRSRGVRTTAVAAVRGAAQSSEDPLKPYWKGGWSEKAAEAYKKESDEFRGAAQLLLDGKADEAVARLNEFKKAHPKSVLAPDVEEALKQAESAQAEQAAPEAPKEEAKEGAKEEAPAAEEAASKE